MSCQWGYDCFRCGAPDCIATGYEIIHHSDPTQTERRKRWKARHPEKEKEYIRRYRETHKEELRKRNRERMREYRARQKEQANAGA